MLSEYEYNGKTMGTEYSIAIICDFKDTADQQYKYAKKQIEHFEAQFSRFLTTSELSILNHKKTLHVSDFFMQATLKARELFTITKGIFNPLVQIAQLGYDKNFTDITHESTALENDSYDIDFTSVIINQNNKTIHLNKDQKIDYGGFLKGYIAQLIAKKIINSTSEIKGVIVNIGGDLYTEGYDANLNIFTFSIYNPVLKNETTVITLHNCGLATSGTYKRFWLHNGKTTNHIINPATKQNPNTPIVSASVVNQDAATAEAYAKVLLSMPLNDARKILPKDTAFILITKDGEVIRNNI